MEDIEYLRRREGQERAAAKRAATVAARAAHQEMALLYATMISQRRAGEDTRTIRVPHLIAA
jgi:hypothetical protein